MAGTITALRFQGRDRERVNVFLDGRFAFALMATEAARLRKGQLLSDAEIAALRGEDERQLAYDQAMRFLSYRPRSRAEMERYLRGKHVDESVIGDTLERLTQAGYLDDEAFARFWVENRSSFRPRSRRALEYELRQKGLSRETIVHALDSLDDEAAAWQAIEPMLPRWTALEGDRLRQKIAGYLGRRGFGYEVINAIFKKACQVLQVRKG